MKRQKYKAVYGNEGQFNSRERKLANLKRKLSVYKEVVDISNTGSVYVQLKDEYIRVSTHRQVNFTTNVGKPIDRQIVTASNGKTAKVVKNLIDSDKKEK